MGGALWTRGAAWSVHSSSDSAITFRIPHMSTSRWLALMAGLGMIPFALSQVPSPSGTPMATADRIQGPAWWPTKGAPAREEYVGPDACGQCHRAKFNSARNTPMAHASTAAAESEILRSHDRLETRIGPYHYEITRTPEGSIYSASDGTRSVSVPLTWAFGMGEVGQTYVYAQDGKWYESHLSYYTSIQGLDYSPGHPRTIPSSLGSALGRLFEIGEPRLCFGCHSTASTTRNQFDPSRLIPGVTCEACHGPGAQHVTKMRLGIADQKPKSILNPATLKPVDSVEFCGACHRTAWDVALAGSKGTFNLRFQPYRLETSRCWGQGDDRLVCIACHDPHEPLVRDLASYDQRCLACHSTTPASNPTADHPGAACRVSTKDCVTCHMRKQEIPGMHAKFTDHRIRVVRKDDSITD